VHVNKVVDKAAEPQQLFLCPAADGKSAGGAVFLFIPENDAQLFMQLIAVYSWVARKVRPKAGDPLDEARRKLRRQALLFGNLLF
jgi:hypothetical protein